MTWHSFPDTNSAPPEVLFRLQASNGQPVALEHYRQRQGLCLLFLSTADQGLWLEVLQALAAAREPLSQREAAPLAVLPTTQTAAAELAGRLQRPLLLLADPDRWMRDRYLKLAPGIRPDETFVFLLDRWGAPLAVGSLDEDWIDEVLSWFDLAQARCPE